MQKRCSNCSEDYWARWRNEPVTLCPACRVRAVICASCSSLVHAPPDPDQAELFPLIVWRPPSSIERPTLEERYYSLRAKASQATRRRYPFC